jgi:hypothetical protein
MERAFLDVEQNDELKSIQNEELKLKQLVFDERTKIDYKMNVL